MLDCCRDRFKKIRYLFVAAAVVVISLPTAQARAEWVREVNAPQVCYQQGVPHTDRNGKMLSKFDPERSFLPIGLYHFMQNDTSGGFRGFESLATAGFNCCHSIVQRPAVIANDAAKAGIQLIIQRPTDDEVRAYKDHSSVFAWYIAEEPTGSNWGPNMESKFKECVDRRSAIKAIDPDHPVLIIDSWWTTPPATGWWVKWNTAGDITSHDNYPINGKQKSLSAPSGIPETVSLAVSSVREQKPMLFCAQAHYFKDPKFGVELPTPAQERCMVYTAFIHGATGVIYFGMDSWVLREGNCVGIAPKPKTDYTPPGTNHQIGATDNQVRASRDLWNAVCRINRELADLRPSILSPTSSVPYEVYIDDKLKSITPDPIRSILKTNPSGGYILLLANIDSVPQKVKVRFPDAATLRVKESFAENDGLILNGDAFEIDCPAYDSRVFSVTL